jgi:[FeFe] hydrogenase H-cluster maturation GTPase HydF
MQQTPKGLRLHIGIYGRRNVGKSSILNAVTGQTVAIVSDVAGTTTDPVEKAMELLPIGPVLFIDTAGVDDVGALGKQRIEKTRLAIQRTDVAVLVAEAGTWGSFETELLAEFDAASLPVIVVFNKADQGKSDTAQIDALRTDNRQVVEMIAPERVGVAAFKQALLTIVPESYLAPPAIVGDLVRPGQMIVLVVPIDLEAPKGRLILPQVQTIRDCLDSDAYCAVVKERELRDLLENMKQPPALIVTDSQAFLKVGGDTPTGVPLTSFSILFARFKGDLPTFAEGAKAIDHLKPGDRILVAEGCTHHPVGEDIGRVKIPRWLTQYVGGELTFDVVSGQDFPDDISPYKLVIHCGSCTFNRRQLLSRIVQCRQAGVPITNYGVAIAFSLGICERALEPFPEALARMRG